MIGKTGRICTRERPGGQRGQVEIASLLVLVVVLGAVGVSAVLLGRTLTAARSINDKADRIAQTGQGINTATDAVVQLTRTNELAGSILETADPLEGLLAEIVALAQSVDGLASSINSTAGGINGTAKEINSTAGGIGGSASTIGDTARGINSEAAGILDVARRINGDVVQINADLDDTIGWARAIKGDTGNVLSTAQSIHKSAACIDRKAGGTRGADGHCQ